MGWWREAACADMPAKETERIFFSPMPVNVAEARAMCWACPVREACLADADLFEQGFLGDRSHSAGIRGGLTPCERRKRRAYLEAPEKSGWVA